MSVAFVYYLLKEQLNPIQDLVQTWIVFFVDFDSPHIAKFTPLFSKRVLAFKSHLKGICLSLGSLASSTIVILGLEKLVKNFLGTKLVSNLVDKVKNDSFQIH